MRGVRVHCFQLVENVVGDKAPHHNLHRHNTVSIVNRIWVLYTLDYMDLTFPSKPAVAIRCGAPNATVKMSALCTRSYMHACSGMCGVYIIALYMSAIMMACKTLNVSVRRL